MAARGVPQKPYDVAEMFQANLCESGCAKARLYLARPLHQYSGTMPCESGRCTRAKLASDVHERRSLATAAEDHYYAALDHYAEGRLAEAIADYEAAIATDPTFLDAMHGLARATGQPSSTTKPSRSPIASPNSILTTFSPTPACRSCISARAWFRRRKPKPTKRAVLGWKQQLKQGKTSQP